MKNAYEIRGDTTAVLLNSPKHGSMETLIATEDLPRTQEFPGTWFPLWSRGTQTFYVRGKLHRGEGIYTAISLHRWIMEPECEGKVVDHVLHDTLDNCRWALQVKSQAENSRNCRRSRRNRSGHSGVSWNARLGKWKAHIRFNYELIHLGYFSTKEQAIEARRTAEAELFCTTQKIS